MPGQFSYRFPSLRRYEYAIIAAVGISIAIYMVVVVRRVSMHGFGDTLVFFRAGWAIWTGYPLYAVTDPHGWSYHYPPTFALLMGLFADPLPGYPKPVWSLPLPLSVATWYAISVGALGFAVHIWAGVIARTLPRIGQAVWNGWWSLRIGPFVALLPFIGDGFGRGQPTAILLLTMVGFLAFYVRGRLHIASSCLAAGITIKLFPVVLLFIPALRRDIRVLGLTAAYCLIFMVVPPLLCLGPTGAMGLFAAMWNEHLSGILTGTPNVRIAAEITFTSYDMTSVAAMLTRIAAGGLPDADALPRWASTMQLILNDGFFVLLAALGHDRFWRLRGPQPAMSDPVLVAGAMICAALPVMLSVSQPNYVALLLPQVALANVEAWRRAGRVGLSLVLTMWSAILWFAMIVIEYPIPPSLRVIGLITPSIIGLLVWSFVFLQKQAGTDRPTLSDDRRAQAI